MCVCTCVCEHAYAAPRLLDISMPGLGPGQDGGRSGPDSDRGGNRLCQKCGQEWKGWGRGLVDGNYPICWGWLGQGCAVGERTVELGCEE